MQLYLAVLEYPVIIIVYLYNLWNQSLSGFPYYTCCLTVTVCDGSGNMSTGFVPCVGRFDPWIYPYLICYYEPFCFSPPPSPATPPPTPKLINSMSNVKDYWLIWFDCVSRLTSPIPPFPLLQPRPQITRRFVYVSCDRVKPYIYHVIA